MIIVTQAQEKILAEHLKYCQAVIQENEQSIILLESGKMRIRDGGRDITDEWIVILKARNKEMRTLLDALRPAEFQRQVNP